MNALLHWLGNIREVIARRLAPLPSPAIRRIETSLAPVTVASAALPSLSLVAEERESVLGNLITALNHLRALPSLRDAQNRLRTVGAEIAIIDAIDWMQGIDLANESVVIF